MEELIKQAFLHVDVIGPHVQEGHYDLIGPNGEIILPKVWENMIEPDWAITMHMWPMPEPVHRPGAPGGPANGHPGGHPFERPRSRHGNIRPPGAPLAPSHNRGPPPPGWPPAVPPPIRPGPPGDGERRPPVVIMSSGSGPRAPRRTKTEPAKGVLGWISGKPGKPAGKGKVSLDLLL
jgi:hypothetical protein